ACRAAVAALPAGVRRLDRPQPYPVVVSEALQALRDRVAREWADGEQ
ncbi:MAG: Nicotinate phosphoribosyltransferase C-terminal domain, partial [Acidobacteria bacterium]|nr:Nicotinate phosphoribosyltransferase C-terminal domain [Acidobacteriota bacterium]